MIRIGQYLLNKGLITNKQLDEALQHHVLVGARIGSCLVELGFLGINELAKHLSEYHRVPLPPRVWLENPELQAVKTVTRSLVIRHRFIPLKLDKGDLHIVMLDPNNPDILDEIRFATGHRVIPYVLPEVVINHFLKRHFKIQSKAQGQKVIAKVGIKQQLLPIGHVSRQDESPRENSQVEQTKKQIEDRDITPRGQNGLPNSSECIDLALQDEKDAHISTRKPVSDGVIGATIDTLMTSQVTCPIQESNSIKNPTIQFQDGPEASLDGEISKPFSNSIDQLNQTQQNVESASQAITSDRVDSPSSDPPISNSEPDGDPFKTETGYTDSEEQSERPKASISNLAKLEQQLMEADDRDKVVDTALTIASLYSQVAALFIVRQGTIQGLQGRKDFLDLHSIEMVLIPVHGDCMLSQVVRSTQSLRIKPELDIDLRLMRALKRDHVTEVGIFPVILKDRVVNLLYIDNGADSIALTTYSALQTLAECTSTAYTNLIRRRKEEQAA